ncbi:MAG: ribosomal-protein-alanine N-acetyltransferase [Chloroflexi bacterium]|nr:MAG: ribosomal-protein-alanine N-acetyltransferase [Chloroflexota bacterium]
MMLTLRYMQIGDVTQVVAIDKYSFETPWSARSYVYEVKNSNYSHMVVLALEEEKRVSGWRRWLRPFNGGNGAHRSQIIGYGGLWHLVDEAHISTIATHPQWRGRGLGEVVLAAMIRRALTLNAAYVVLEVRVSNIVAQNLYTKYGFYVVGTKAGYYRDNDEDAYDMRLNLHRDMRPALDERWRALQAKHGFRDLYTESQRPPVVP